MLRRALAEFIGTFWLVFAGCGAAVMAAPRLGWLGVSLAFGLTVVTMAYTLGPISGCHLNPAVTLGLLAGRRISWKDVFPYILMQTLGALLAALLLHWLATHSGNPSAFAEAGKSLASNSFGPISPGLPSWQMPKAPAPYLPWFVAFALESLLTFFFVLIILGSTDKRAPKGFAPLAIGLGLTLIHLVGIPFTNLSVNPARSTGPAVVVAWLGNGPNHMLFAQQLWLFWAAPIAGGLLAGLLYPLLAGKAEPTNHQE